MPPVPAGVAGQHGPSTFEKAKMGAMMGASVGLCIGLIFGVTNIVRFGPGPNGFLRTLGQYMAGSAATFGFFMGIGTVVRTDTERKALEEFARARRRPMVLPAEFRYPQSRQMKPLH
ncbi:uncharacterized protein PV09_04877 [Verruconis gallopava]|uniref:Protein mgr2 n=1 Tax=Verruconis gallopava TaxID=253628 RepID=A0A0D2AY51_9PEZI|nr:uncharacterized protein PV09_04877 [Verruconis gallopava]KIW04059.1 hypothetical protein PV09_04877 [Verruconis gallopava]